MTLPAGAAEVKPVSTTEVGAVAASRPAGPHDHHFGTDHLMADLKGRSVRGGAITVGAQGIKFFLQMGSTVVLARLLTPADFGLIAMVSAFTGFVGLFKDLGLSMATVQRAEITHEQVSTLFWINAAVSVVLTGVAVAIAPFVAWFYGEPELLLITIAVGTTFIFAGLSAQHTALLRRQMRFRGLALIDIASMAAGVAVAVVMAVLDFGYWSLVGLTVGTAIMQCVVTWMVSRWRPGLPIRGCGVASMIRFGGGLTGFNIVNYFTRNADNVIVGFALGSGPLGIYSKAYHLLMMPIRQFNAPVTSIMIPALSRLQNDPVRYRRAYLHAIGTLAFIGMPLVALLFVVADEAVLLLLGPGWEEAAVVFRVLAPAALFGTINVAPGWLCISLGRARVQLVWALISAPVTVTAFIIGAQWGIVGVAAGFSISWCVTFVLFLAMACRRSPVPFSAVIYTLAGTVFCTAVATTVSLMISPKIVSHDPGLILSLAIHSTVFVMSYLGVTLLIPVGRMRLRSIWSQGLSSLSFRPGG